MACVTTSKNLDCIIDSLEFEDMEAFEMDESLLMALLDDESSKEQKTEEGIRLGSLISSLEAELDNGSEILITNSSSSTSSSSSSSSSSSATEDYGSEDGGQEYCSMSSEATLSHIENFDWINDMEMDSIIISPISDDYEMGIDCSWYMDTSANELEVGMIEFGELRDYDYQFEYDYNNSLWQETY